MTCYVYLEMKLILQKTVRLRYQISDAVYIEVEPACKTRLTSFNTQFTEYLGY